MMAERTALASGSGVAQQEEGDMEVEVLGTGDNSSRWKVCRSLDWSVRVPRRNEVRLSPVFIVGGIEYRFRLHRDRDHFSVALQVPGEGPDRLRPLSRVRFRSVHAELKKGSFSAMLYHFSTGMRRPGAQLRIEESAVTSKLTEENQNTASLRFLFVMDNDDQPERTSSRDRTAALSLLQESFLNTASPETRLGCHFLSKDLEKLLDSDNADVVLVCGDREFKAHRCLLSSRSEVLASMLRRDTPEGDTGRIEIRDIEADLFGHFLRYLYSGKLPPTITDKMIPLYEIANRYGVDALKVQCGLCLTKNLVPTAACDVLLLAYRYNDPSLKERTIMYMLDQKIPLQDDLWSDFSKNHPHVAVKVLNRFCRFQASTK